MFWLHFMPRITADIKPRDSIMQYLHRANLTTFSESFMCSHLWWWVWYYRLPHFMDGTVHKEINQPAQSLYAGEEKRPQSGAKYCSPHRRAILLLPCWLLTCMSNAKIGNVLWCGGQQRNTADSALQHQHATIWLTVKVTEKKRTNDRSSTVRSHSSGPFNTYLLSALVLFPWSSVCFQKR